MSVLLAPILLVAIAQEPAAPKVEVQDVGPAKQNDTIYVSPKGVHVAIVTQKGSRMIVLLDGVEGPKFDDVVQLDNGQKVVFSADGTRSAYVGRSGDDYVLMVDGKEAMRPGNAKDGYGSSPVSQLSFTPSGKHWWFMLSVRKPPEKGGGNYPCVVWDGAIGPPDGVNPVISPDGEHHAYTVTNRNDVRYQAVVLDGKPAGYMGADPMFSGDSRHLFVRTWVPLEKGGQALQVLMDGKPYLKAQEARVHPAPVGDLVASVIRRFDSGAETSFLVVGGKKVEGSDTSIFDRMTFSPDGKRYAAQCRTAAGAQFVLVDGQRGQEYANVSDVEFSPDSSRFWYRATMNGKTFVIVDGEESDGFLTVESFTYGGGGKRTAYVAQTDPMSKTLVIDGQAAERKAQAFTELRFSEDGSHFAYLFPGTGGMRVVLDGVENTEMAVRPFQSLQSQTSASIRLSRDGKHVAAFASASGNPPTLGLWLDGKLVHATQALFEPTFTPDGNHLAWVSHDPRAGRHDVHVDGVSCARFTGGYAVPANSRRWEMGEDGVITLVAQDGERVKRFRITPSPSTSLETLIANPVKLDK